MTTPVPPPANTNAAAATTEDDVDDPMLVSPPSTAAASDDDNGGLDHFDKDGFPSLFQETLSMAISASFAFVIADLRKAAREGTMLSKSDSTLLMNLPIKYGDLQDLLSRNEATLQKILKPDVYDVVYNVILKSIDNPEINVFRQSMDFNDGSCYIVGDSNPNQECVYAITKSSDKIKRIILSFRGSITIQDWIQDFKIIMGEIQNPLLDTNYMYNSTTTADNAVETKESKDKIQEEKEEQSETLRVHVGFRDYLYGSATSIVAVPKKVGESVSKVNKAMIDGIETLRRSGKGTSSSCDDDNSDEPPPPPPPQRQKQLQRNGTKTEKSKIEIIISEVVSLLRQHPDYKLYISGHSLGGALAIMTALELTPIVMKLQQQQQQHHCPVTCITIGNPKVGNNQFCRAIQTLEEEKKIRILTIQNKYDLVPMVPDPFWTCYVCSYSERSFHHAGWVMKLVATRRNDTYYIYHRKTSRKNKTNPVTFMKRLGQKLERYLIVFGSMHQIKKRHFYGTYVARLLSHKDELNKLYINDLYKGKLN